MSTEYAMYSRGPSPNKKPFLQTPIRAKIVRAT